MFNADRSGEVEYRAIDGYPKYRVGSDGSVWSKAYGNWRKLKQAVNKAGYCVVGLYAEPGRRRVIGVHVLVATAFHGPKQSPELQCRHLDGNPRNNIPSNLRWGTGKENAEDRERHGTQHRGTSHPMSRLTEDQVAEIKHLLVAGERHTDIAVRYGVDKTLISHIACGRIWRHVGGPAIRTRPKCKIADDDVRCIRKMRSCGATLDEIMAVVPLSRGSISMIANGKRWRHVK